MEPNYAKLGDKIEKKILDSHKDLLLKGRLTEAAGKVAYIKLAQSLPTFGTNFFVVKVKKEFWVRTQAPRINNLSN